MNIEKLVILAECSDGKVRQLLIEKRTANIILDTIVKLERTIRILDEPIESIKIEDRLPNDLDKLIK